MAKKNKAWHDATAGVNAFFDELNFSNDRYMINLRSINRMMFSKDTIIVIYERIAERTKKELDVKDHRHSKIIEYCNDNIKIFKESKITDDAFREIKSFTLFGKSYKTKLDHSLRDYGIQYTEIDFLKNEILNCKNIIDSKECIELEIKELYKQRIFAFEKKRDELENRINVGAVIVELNHGQKILTEEDVIIINKQMKYLIDAKFKYFDEQYLNNDFKEVIKSVFSIATYFFFELGEVQYASQAQKKLSYIHISDNNRWINSKLLDFKRFFAYLKDINYNDTIKLYNAFNIILEGYESICMLHGYNFKKSFCYETINTFANEVKEKYDGPLLNIEINDKKNNSHFEATKQIHLTDEGIERLKKSLLGKINENEQQTFIDLINGKHIKGKVFYESSCISFCRILKDMTTKNEITNNTNSVINWIVDNFNFMEKKKAKEFSISTVTKHMKSQKP